MTIKKLLGKLKFSTKRILIPSICVLVAVGAVLVGVIVTRGNAAESGMVSAGLQQLAGERYLACSAVAGQEIVFDAAWFDEALGGGTVNAITVTALPPVTDGTLRLGYGAVTAGQSIPRETLSYLTFIPADGVKNSSFSFVPSTRDGEVSYALTCALRVTDSVNCCPVGNKSLNPLFPLIYIKYPILLLSKPYELQHFYLKSDIVLKSLQSPTIPNLSYNYMNCRSLKYVYQTFVLIYS